MTQQSPHAEFTDAARRCSEVILRRYSTSFALACRLLSPATRPHVAAIYAWARVGDEVVDGAMDDPVAARELIAEARRLVGASGRGVGERAEEQRERRLGDVPWGTGGDCAEELEDLVAEADSAAASL